MDDGTIENLSKVPKFPWYNNRSKTKILNTFCFYAVCKFLLLIRVTTDFFPN